MAQPKLLLRVADVAEALAVSERVVYRLISDGAIATVNVNSVRGGRARIRITSEAVQDFIAARTTERPKRVPA